MIFLQALATIGLLIVNSLGPGLFFIRWLRWRPLETLCGSVALSFFILYLATFGIYSLNLPPGWAYVPSAAAAIATIVCRRDIHRLWRNRETRGTILAFLALFSWLFILLLSIRLYSGGRWYGDWYEHYHRALYFADHLPLDTLFLKVFILPARPPMMNLLATAIFWQVAPSFEIYQITFCYLNALSLLPCVLIAPSLVARTRNRAWLVAGVLALSPMFVWNSTYTWTKLFAAFYELTALGFYLSAWRRNEASRMVAAFACFAAGMLVHYSVGPMVLFVAGHYFVVLFRHRQNRWRELAASAALGAAVFATWLTWSLLAYGIHDTFGSNTTTVSSQQLTFAENVSKVASNTFNTLVPALLRGGFEKDVSYDREVPPQELAYLRDWCFAIYQPQFPASLGLAGLLLVSWLLAMLCFRAPKDRWQHRRVFWLLLVVFVTIVGIAVHGEPDYLGVAHICLQPLVLLGLTFAAAGLPHVPRWLRGIALVAILIDAGLGIFLQFYELRIDHTVGRDGDRVTVSHAEMGMSTIANALLKADFHVTYLGDHAADYAGYLLAVMVVVILAIPPGLWWTAERDARTRANRRTVSTRQKRRRSR
jgi:4-amino-4-deoxy-L-arabinose transferase-like glycosyltransferase